MKTIAVYAGGGMKGYAESVFSEMKDIQADMYAGTSIGGIIACARSAGLDWQSITEIFVKDGKKIFKGGACPKIRMGLGKSRYNNKHLKKVLVDIFGSSCMEDLSPVCVTAMGITEDNYGPHFFSEKSKDSVVDVCMATSAAPTYFDPYNGYIDGGVFMNNPVTYAILKAKRQWPTEELRIINIGSGRATRNKTLYGKSSNGVDLISDTIRRMMEGSEMASREMMERFSDDFGINYEYYDFVYAKHVKLDSTDKESLRVMRRAATYEFIRSNNKEL